MPDDNMIHARQPEAATAHWYVIRTKPRQEIRALSNLQQQGFEAYLPVLAVSRLRRGSVRMVEEPLFSRYLFVRFDEAHSPWHHIRNTLGVSELVRIGSRPARMPDDLMYTLMHMQPAPQALFERGDTLRITTGPFRDLHAVYDIPDGDQRAIVLIELLNKTQRIAVSLNALRKQN